MLASFTVVSAGDAPFGSCTALQCTLRDAVSAANGSAGADTITFAPAITGTVTLAPTNGALVISGPLSIDGPGSSVLTVQANATTTDFRVFDITDSAGDVTIEGLTITGGNIEGGDGGGIRFSSAGTLSIQNSVVTGNRANGGGGIRSEFDGTIEVIDSNVSNNETIYFSGGGISTNDGDVILTRSIVSGNEAFGSGAGIFSFGEGDVTISDSTVSDNSATGAGYVGGGIYSGDGDVTITGSTVSGNASAGDAGGLYSLDGTVNISDTTFASNRADGSGGAIFKSDGALTITDSLIESNLALLDDGGGIVNLDGTLAIVRSTVRGNSAGVSGGGAINSTGDVTITDSTFSLNTADDDGGGMFSSSGVLTLTNATFTLNDSSRNGGAIFAVDADVSLVNSTVVNNSAFNRGGGIDFADAVPGESLSLLNSVVAENIGNVNADFSAPAGGAASLTVLSSFIGSNEGTGLVASASPDADGNRVGTSATPLDPLLDDLADNGGTTVTMLPLIGSPLIDAGRLAGSPAADQRGVSRPIGAGVDIGAVEAPLQIQPEIVGVVVNDGEAQRSMLTSLTVTFNTTVNPALLASAVSVTNITTSTPVDIVNVAVDNTTGVSVATLTFGAGASVVTRLGTGGRGNSLVDGNYRLNILASGTVDAVSSLQMASNYSFGGQVRMQVPNDNFFRLYGDANGDGARNNTDITPIIASFNSPPRYRPDFDVNGDGVINNTDIAAHGCHVL